MGRCAFQFDVAARETDDPSSLIYYDSVFCRINVKIGGINSYAAPHERIIEMMKDVIIVGALTFVRDRTRALTLCDVVGCDVTHSPGVTCRPSVASLVVSTDVGATRYKVHLDVQSPCLVIITNIVPMLDVSVFRSLCR